MARLRQSGILPSQAVASPLRRRVTRSQSREVEDVLRPSKYNDYSSRSVRDDQQSQDMWGQSKALTTVVEETPSRSPQKSGFRYGNSVIPESPEDTVNISGTTILPSEPETDFDPEMMLEALPDLERASKNVLDFLAPSSATPVDIVNRAKQLSDPRNTQSRRVQRLRSNLASESKYFGNTIYLNAERVGGSFFSALAGRRGDFQKDWSPDPVLHMANCAQLTVNVLLASAGSNSQRQAVKNVESLFPLPFMNDLVKGSQTKGPGESSLEKDTFELALDLRTQSFLMQLEDHQHDPQFNHKPAVRQCFFTSLSRNAPLRGFNLPSLGGHNGSLPAEYRDAVQHRFNEILLAEMEDGVIDVEELKGTYSWRRFVLRVAEWVRKRTAEISKELETHMSAQDVRDAFFSAKQPSFTSTLGDSEGEPNTTTDLTQQETSQEEVPAPAEPQRDSEPGQKDKARRRSSKPSFLNASSIQRVMQRQERLRSEIQNSDTRRQSDIVRAVSHQVGEESSTNRRRTLPAFPSQRSTQVEELREIPPSLGDSPTLLPDELDITLDIGNEGTQLERSHSPPVVNRRSPPSSRREIPSVNLEQAVSKTVLRAIKTGVYSQPSASTTRSARPAFIDRQVNAERVSPISQLAEPQSAVRRVEARVSRKRARQASAEESEDNEDFFNYDRPVDIDRRRAEKPQQPVSKRQRLDNDREESVDEDDQEEPTQASPQRRRASRISSTLSSTREYLNSTRSSSTHLRWTPQEDKRLVRLIEQYGCSWAQIARQNDAQPVGSDETRIEGRNQVQLKDRARNLKIKFLRESLPLPKNFHNVTMKAKDYEMLERRGIIVPRP